MSEFSSNKSDMVRKTIELFWQTFPPVWHAARTATHRVAAEEFEITPSQFHVLRRIADGKGSVSDLSDCMHLSRPNISRTVDELVNSGYVRRRRDADDRRNIILSLTRDGQKLIKGFHKKIGDKMAELFINLDLEDLISVQRGLESLQKIFNNEENGPDKYE